MTHQINSKDDEEDEWMKMYDIDNPLHPWEVNFREDLKGIHLPLPEADTFLTNHELLPLLICL